MGNSKSKNKPGSRGKAHRKGGRHGQSAASLTNQTEEYEDMELLLLRRAIRSAPESFILNNLMMCVQFFGNYEEEIEHVKETLVSSHEAELNKRLPPQKRVLLPDVLQGHIARNVGFTSTRQTQRPTVEPLLPVRIYTVHDNIDITEQDYSSHYSSVSDSIMYNIVLRPTEHEGYVQLQLVEEFGKSRDRAKEDDTDLSSITEVNDEFYSDGGSIYGPKPRSNASVYSMLSQKSKQSLSKNLDYGHTRSLPNLHNEENAREDRQDLYRSSRNVKDEIDRETNLSIEERRFRSKKARPKGEFARRDGRNRRWEKQPQRTKAPESAGQEHATSSNSSGYQSDNYAMDSDSSCNPSQLSNVSQNSNDEEMDSDWITSAELPDRCFKKVTYTAEGKLYDPREERKQLQNSKQRRIKLALWRYNYSLFYASSTEFMKHFIKLFMHRLADSFGFDKEAVEDARREGCVLYCDKVMVSNTFKHSRVEQYEIIPAIWLQWPTCAQEWLDRSRSTWPDYNDIEKIKDYGCYVVPEGFVPKTGNSNIIGDLEWQLTFPTAERYLETCMTQAQVQVYFITLMLHKTFMRPIFDTMFGLTAAHIRHKLFWMIEENDRPSRWPDNRMGECLLSLLNSLYHNISQNEPILRDYFIAGRNLFQRVPCEHLLHTQKQLKRIIENPVMYVLHAMENIRYSENFFPRLDYEMLLKILTMDTLTLVNPALTQHISKATKQRSSEERVAQDDKYSKRGFCRKAVDSIIEISIRCAELESPRLCALLDFFIRHFIKIAERCNQYRAYRQKSIYLDQADRLSILLFEHQRYKEDARAYRDKIKVLRKKVANSKSRENLPEIPKRNAETAIYVGQLKDRFARDPPEKVYDSPRTNDNDHQQVRSDQNIDRPVQNITEAIVHRETHYQEPDEQISNLTKSKMTPTLSADLHSTNETQALESKIDEEYQPAVVTHIKLSESLNDESTYI